MCVWFLRQLRVEDAAVNKLMRLKVGGGANSLEFTPDCVWGNEVQPPLRNVSMTITQTTDCDSDLHIVKTTMKAVESSPWQSWLICLVMIMVMLWLFTMDTYNGI